VLLPSNLLNEIQYESPLQTAKFPKLDWECSAWPSFARIRRGAPALQRGSPMVASIFPELRWCIARTGMGEGRAYNKDTLTMPLPGIGALSLPPPSTVGQRVPFQP